MKKLMRHFASLLMVMLACVALPSCGGDDEPEDQPENSYPITIHPTSERLVGTWETEDWDSTAGDIIQITLKEDGSGYQEITEYVNGERVDHLVYAFTWSYSWQNNYLTLHYAPGVEDEDWVVYIPHFEYDGWVGYTVDDDGIDTDDPWLFKRV